MVKTNYQVRFYRESNTGNKNRTIFNISSKALADRASPGEVYEEWPMGTKGKTN